MEWVCLDRWGSRSLSVTSMLKNAHISFQNDFRNTTNPSIVSIAMYILLDWHLIISNKILRFSHQTNKVTLCCDVITKQLYNLLQSSQTKFL